MNVLGLHGVYPRSHDASACLVKDQEISAYAEEERFVRIKKAFDLKPDNATTFCFESTGRDVNELDAVAIGLMRGALTTWDVLPEQFADSLEHRLPIVQVEHHEAHAASVFYTSPFIESAVVVIDGQGEHESTSIWRGSEKGLDKLESFDVNRSLGYLYSAVSKFCGLGTFGAGKLMGLAPYGEPKYVELLADVYRGIHLPPQTGPDSQDAFFEQFLGKMYALGLPEVTYSYDYDPRAHKARKMPELRTIHRDMAASVQVLLEQEVIEIVRRAKMLTGSDNLCLAGGVAMNCVANSLVQNSGIYQEVFLQPGCEDCGVALGSAAALGKQKIDLDSIYTGPSFGDDQIGVILSELGISATRYDDIAAKTAQLLADNQIVGWFQGGMEYGPRSLGGRSILANPATTATRDEVNRVKGREPWRPFGPSVLAERTSDLFEKPHESNYMLRSFSVQEAWKSRLAGIVHIDGSTRAQTVSQADNPRYHELILAFDSLTGLPAVLNTSFNNYDEPLVASPLDAIRTFYSTSLGALALGEYLIIK